MRRNRTGRRACLRSWSYRESSRNRGNLKFHGSSTRGYYRIKRSRARSRIRHAIKEVKRPYRKSRTYVAHMSRSSKVTRSTRFLRSRKTTHIPYIRYGQSQSRLSSRTKSQRQGSRTTKSLCLGRSAAFHTFYRVPYRHGSFLRKRYKSRRTYRVRYFRCIGVISGHRGGHSHS